MLPFELWCSKATPWCVDFRKDACLSGVSGLRCFRRPEGNMPFCSLPPTKQYRHYFAGITISISGPRSARMFMGVHFVESCAPLEGCEGYKHSQGIKRFSIRTVLSTDTCQHRRAESSESYLSWARTWQPLLRKVRCGFFNIPSPFPPLPVPS